MSDKTEVYPYKRSGDSPLYFRRSFRRSRVCSPGLPQRAMSMVSSGMLLSCTAAFLVGRAVIMGELFPFVPAFSAAAAMALGRRGIIPLAFLCAGVATVSGGYGLTSNIILAVLSFLLVQAVPPRYRERRGVIPVLVFGLTVSVKSALFAFAGPTPYDYINIFFESIFAAALTPVCLSVFASGWGKNRVKPLETEEMVCLMVFMAGVIAGTGDLRLWQISVKGFLSRTIILMAALAGGSGLGAAAGAVVGIIPGLSYTVTPYIVGAYSFSGVLAGLGRAIGKVGVSLSFLASNIILSVYFNNFESMESVVAETGLACLIFLLVPEKMVKGLSAAVSQESSGEESEKGRESLKAAFREKVREYSELFREMSRAFGENTALIEKKQDEQGLKQVVGEIGKKVCSGCGMHRVCWESDYYRTYQNLLEIFALTEVHGRLDISDLPGEMRKRCSRPRDLAITAACLYEVFKIDRRWRRKYMAGRGLVGEQLRGISGVFDSFGEVFDIDPDGGGYTDSDLVLRLRQLGIPVNKIKTAESGGRREMLINMRACKGELDCRYRVAPVISELAGQLFSVTGSVCEGRGDGECSFRLYQGPHYRIEVGAAGAGKDGSPVSGDIYDFLQLRGGKFAAVLSDGMGAGQSAAAESSSAVGLLREMLEAGLSIDLAIKSVNTVQSLRNPEESFAAMDMTVINLYTGQAEFIKTATPPTYLIRGGRLVSIRGGSLPVGILSDIDINITERRLASGDVIVMLTDGVLLAGRGPEEGEGWVAGVLRELNGLEPREMAELLLKLAQTGSAGEVNIPDDMAVVVIRVEREKVVEIPRQGE